MHVIRDENVDPAPIEEALPGGRCHGEFRVEVVGEHAIDDLTVRAEAVAGCSESDLQQAVLSRPEKKLGPTTSVEIVRAESLGLTEFTSRRIPDRRDLSPEPKTRKPRRGRRIELSTAP